MAVAERHRRFTVDELYRMADAGIFHEDDRVELLDGEIIEMTPIGSRHGSCVDRLNRLLVRGAGDRAIVRIQNPVTLSEVSEPVPDVALLAARNDFYASGHPGPGDVLLVIEVADTTLRYDRGRKSAAYARAGIPELWIVDLGAGAVLVRRQPRGDEYRLEKTLHRGERLAVAALPDVELTVDDILPD